MYHLKFYRSGEHNKSRRINKEMKGAFYKDFETLSGIADFLSKENELYLVEPISKSLSKKESNILIRKYNSVCRKKHALVTQ